MLINPTLKWGLHDVTVELLGKAARVLLASLLLLTTTAFCLDAKVAMKSQIGDQMAYFLRRWPNPEH